MYCAQPSHGPDVRLSILGSAPTILPMSLGGDNEDLYSLRRDPFFAYSFDTPSESLQRVVRLPSQANDQDTTQGQNDQTLSTGTNFSIQRSVLADIGLLPFAAPVGVPLATLDDQRVPYPLSARLPDDEPPLADYLPNTASGLSIGPFPTGGSTAPEPSTWMMLALGFCGLGYAAFHRARKSAVTIS